MNKFARVSSRINSNCIHGSEGYREKLRRLIQPNKFATKKIRRKLCQSQFITKIANIDLFEEVTRRSNIILPTLNLDI